MHIKVMLQAGPFCYLLESASLKKGSLSPATMVSHDVKTICRKLYIYIYNTLVFLYSKRKLRFMEVQSELN